MCTSQGMLLPQKSSAGGIRSSGGKGVSAHFSGPPGSPLAFGFAAEFLLQGAPMCRTCTGAFSTERQVSWYPGGADSSLGSSIKLL